MRGIKPRCRTSPAPSSPTIRSVESANGGGNGQRVKSEYTRDYKRHQPSPIGRGDFVLRKEGQPEVRVMKLRSAEDTSESLISSEENPPEPESVPRFLEGDDREEGKVRALEAKITQKSSRKGHRQNT